LKAAIEWGKKDGELAHEYSLVAPRDHIINKVVWGPLDKSIYYCTNEGRLIHYCLETKEILEVRHPHIGEILSITITQDFTMLFTTGKDGTCKLLHPQTLDEIRSYKYEFPCRDA